MVEELIRNLNLKVEFIGFKEFLKRKLKAEFTPLLYISVLPETKEVEVQLNQSDIQIDTFRASGAGGQHVNKTESAIRLTHIPLGVVVECQDERSQFKNKENAMNILSAKLYEAARKKVRMK